MSKVRLLVAILGIEDCVDLARRKDVGRDPKLSTLKEGDGNSKGAPIRSLSFFED